MNLFKLLIPKENTQEIQELESWTVTWQVYEGRYMSYDKYSKVFVNKEHAKEFEKQLVESAKFIKAYIKTDLTKN